MILEKKEDVDLLLRQRQSFGFSSLGTHVQT